MKDHFQLLAAYNSRMNKQVYNTAMELSETELEKNMGAFFGSILATLNHIMVGDLLWLQRISKNSKNYKSLSKLSEFKQPEALNDILFKNIFELYDNRVHLDKIIVEWAGELS